MELRLTLVDPAGTGPPVDVRISAAPGTPLGHVRQELLNTVGHTDGVLHAHGAALDDNALLGFPPLLDGTALTLDVSSTPPAGRALLELRVVAGPDAGTAHRLTPGERTIGRAVEASVRIEDPDVSRLHAVLDVATSGVRVRDLGSTNGTTVEGCPVGGDGAAVPTGSLLQIGESTLVLTAPDALPAAVRPDGAGRLHVNRAPRLLPPVKSVEIALPPAPVNREAPRFPLLMVALPLVFGAALFVLSDGQVTYLLFLLLSPMMLLGNFVSERITGGRGNRRARREYDHALLTAREGVDRAVAAEAVRRRASTPDLAALLLIARGPTSRLWERRRNDEDFLTVRVGSADLPSAVTVRDPAAGSDAARDRPFVGSVPVTVALREVGVLGLAGPRHQLLALGRSVLAQLAGLHSPRDLAIVVLGAEGDSHVWQWSSLLPHLRPVHGQDCAVLVGFEPPQIQARINELLEHIAARRSVPPTVGGVDPRSPSWVVVMDGARSLRAFPGASRLMAEGPAAGITVVCLDEDPVALPAECRATAVIGGEVGTRVRLAVEGREPVESAVADLVSSSWADRFGRALAPLCDVSADVADARLPVTARLLDLLPVDGACADAVQAGWAARPRSTVGIIGATADGIFTVDLSADGPHLLVAGTTGSGKSELLQTLVASLAVVNRPDAMSFLLVDYKGGSAFGECARLPHTVGLVTDLDGRLTGRALSSLGAELRRRERILGDAGRKDLDDYLAHLPSGQPALPRLVLVVDEFATLAEELPDFVGGLVGIAMRGRSLGLHLVLATQRPGGVVSADIRANTSLRICLRVTDAAESRDVIDTGEAATIARTTPGRAYARSGSGSVVAFQSARVSGHPATPEERTASVRRIGWPRDGDPAPAPTSGSTPTGPSDLTRLVRATAAAARSLDVAPTPSPWLPPLPLVVTLQDLAPSTAWSLPLGLADLPAEQRRAVVELDLQASSHLLVAGGPRSGRTTALRALVAGVASRFAVSDVHLYAIDAGGGALASLAGLPHCGAAVPRDAPARGDRLLVRLLDEVTRRQAVLAAGGFASVAEQRAASPPHGRLPWILLVLDSWEDFVTTYDRVDAGRPVEALLRVLREGAAVGVRAVVTGGRGALTGRLASLLGDRLVLRLPDPGDYALAGINRRQVPERLAPGRGIRSTDGVEMQIALLDPDPSGPAQQAALGRLARAAAHSAREVAVTWRPMRVDALPERVSAVDAAGAVDAAAAARPLWVLLGVGGDELGPLGVDLAAAGPVFVVAGPARSGRSTTLGTMARWLTARGVSILVVAPRRSPLRELAGHPGVLDVLGADEGSRLDELLHATEGPLVTFADDVEALRDTPVEATLSALIRTRGESPRALVIAGDSGDLASSYRGLAVDARRHRCGLLLAPTGAGDGDLLGIRVPRADSVLAGRGVLVVRDSVTPVQVAQ